MTFIDNPKQQQEGGAILLNGSRKTYYTNEKELIKRLKYLQSLNKLTTKDIPILQLPIRTNIPIRKKNIVIPIQEVIYKREVLKPTKEYKW